MQFLELNAADGQEIDIPMSGALAFMGMAEGMNEHFPDAKAFIWYQLGDEIRTAIVTNTVADIIMDLNINVAPQDWIKLHLLENDQELMIRCQNIEGRIQKEDRTVLTVNIAGHIKTFEVKEERTKIKKWTERAERGGSAMPIDMPE